MSPHLTERKARRMWKKSYSSFPPDIYACLTYPHKVNVKVFVFPLLVETKMFFVFSG